MYSVNTYKCTVLLHVDVSRFTCQYQRGLQVNVVGVMSRFTYKCDIKIYMKMLQDFHENDAWFSCQYDVEINM